MSNFTTEAAQKTLREVNEWLSEFGAMADGNGSRCARLMRELLGLVETRHTKPTRIWDDKRKMYRHPDEKPEDIDPRPDYYRGHHFRCDIWPGGLGHCTCSGPLSEDELKEHASVIPEIDKELSVPEGRLKILYVGDGSTTTIPITCPKCNGTHIQDRNGGDCAGPPLPSKPTHRGMMG